MMFVSSLPRFLVRARDRRPHPAQKPLLERLEERLELAGGLTYAVQEVAAVGDLIPGGGGITFANDFEPGTINGKGDVAFIADISSGGEGVFLATKGGSIRPLALSGRPPRAVGRTAAAADSPIAMNAAGDVVFPFLLATPPRLACSQVLTHDANRERRGHSGRHPGAGGRNLPRCQPARRRRQPRRHRLRREDRHGRPRRSVLQGYGVFLASKNGSIITVAAPGDSVPGGTLHYAWNPSINNRGDVAFEGSLTGVLYQNGVYVK